MIIKNTIIVLSVIALYFFSFHPFLWMVSALPVSKNGVFTIIIALLIYLLTITILVKEKSFSKQLLLIFFSYILFSLYALASYFITGDLLDDIYNIGTILFINPIFILLAMNCRINKMLVLKTLFFLSGVYFCYFISSASMGNISLISDSFQSVFQDGSSSYQATNQYLGLFSLINLFMTIIAHNKPRKTIHIVLSLSSFFAMLFIGGKASFVSLLISATLFLALVYRSKTKLIVTICTILFFIIILAFIYKDSLLNSVTIMRFLALIDTKSDSSMRLFLFSSAINLFFSSWKTFLFGSGINSFPVYIGYCTVGMYPHNIFLELVAEYGLIGFSLFFFPIIYIFRIRIRCCKSIFGNSIVEKAVFSLSLYYLIIFSVTGGLRYSWTIIFYLYLLIPSQVNLTKTSQKT